MATVLDKTNDSSPTGDDVLYLINNPGGTPGDRKATVDALAASAPFSSRYFPQTAQDALLAAAAADAIRFVSTAGSDSNTGLSRAKPLLTIEAAYAALPSTGGMIEMGAGTFALAATGATTGLTISATKPCHFRGRGLFLSRIRYVGTGIGIQCNGGVGVGYTFSLVDCGIEATSTAATVRVLFLNDVHRCYITRASLVGYSNTAGSVTLLMTKAYQTYIKDSVIYGNHKAVHMTTECQDSSLTDTSCDAGPGIAVHIVDSSGIRIQGGQISGDGTNVGLQIDELGGAGGMPSAGCQVLTTHFEGNDVDIAVGPAATTHVDWPVHGFMALCMTPNGILLDRTVKPYCVVSRVGSGGAGKTAEITANSSDAYLYADRPDGYPPVVVDNGVRSRTRHGNGDGTEFLGALTLLALCTASSYRATNGSPAYDFNPATGTGNYLRSLVGAEANERFSMQYQGKMLWGPGGASGVDTILERLSSAVLGVTGKLTASAGLGVGNSAAATTPGTVTKKMQVFDASGASLGYVAIYDAIT